MCVFLKRDMKAKIKALGCVDRRLSSELDALRGNESKRSERDDLVLKLKHLRARTEAFRDSYAMIDRSIAIANL